MNIRRSDRPIITSGMTIGPKTSPVKTARPRKRPCRSRTRAASVPRTVASRLARIATFSDTQAAARSGPSDRSNPYQRVENPPQTVTSGEALNE
jgi:hypothetical protein